MADYQDVQIARRVVRIINGPDFTLINIMVIVLVLAIVVAAVGSLLS